MSPQAADLEYLTDVNGEIANGGMPSTTGVRGHGISVHVTTFNCANSPHPKLPIAFPSSPPDLLVLGLQELAPAHIAFLNLPVIEELYLKGIESVADIARKHYGKEYELVKVVRIGQTALIVWSSLGARLRKVQTAWAGCGVFTLLANKGAAAARLGILDGISNLLNLLMIDNGALRELTLVAAHLAAREGHFYRRNADFQSLVQNLVFQDGSGIFKPHTPLFFLGDLNYRLSVLHPSRSGTRLTISPDETHEDEHSLIALLKENILDFLETGKFTNLVRHDQLPLSPLALHLNEAPITFSPTYKYLSHDPPTYTTTRTPSWTDRILFSPESIVTKDYRSSTCATFSDHQAVCLEAVLRKQDFEEEEGVMPWDINPAWRERREFGERLGYAVGAMEFMGMTKVGVMVLAILLSGMALYFY
jgi:endonuclease/exonuclease/phosphatase family metal-dependent hydrolase